MIYLLRWPFFSKDYVLAFILLKGAFAKESSSIPLNMEHYCHPRPLIISGICLSYDHDHEEDICSYVYICPQGGSSNCFCSRMTSCLLWIVRKGLSSCPLCISRTKISSTESRTPIDKSLYQPFNVIFKVMHERQCRLSIIKRNHWHATQMRHYRSYFLPQGTRTSKELFPSSEAASFTPRTLSILRNRFSRGPASLHKKTPSSRICFPPRSSCPRTTNYFPPRSGWRPSTFRHLRAHSNLRSLANAGGFLPRKFGIWATILQDNLEIVARRARTIGTLTVPF